MWPANCSAGERTDLKVAMDDFFLVTILNGRYDLSELGARLLLLHATVCDQVVEHLAAGRVLHHQIQGLLGVDHLVEFHNVRMIKHLHDSNFAKQFLETRMV